MSELKLKKQKLKKQRININFPRNTAYPELDKVLRENIPAETYFNLWELMDVSLVGVQRLFSGKDGFKTKHILAIMIVLSPYLNKFYDSPMDFIKEYNLKTNILLSEIDELWEQYEEFVFYMLNECPFSFRSGSVASELKKINKTITV